MGWGNWATLRNCPLCGDGSSRDERRCYNHTTLALLSHWPQRKLNRFFHRSVMSSEFREWEIDDSLCVSGEDKSMRENACWNKCSWSEWNRSNCYDTCHREYWRDCVNSDKGKVQEINCSKALGGSNRMTENWSKGWGGWGCKNKMSDKAFNWFG